MNMLEAFDLTGSLRDAGELAGCSHHTVAAYVAGTVPGVAVTSLLLVVHAGPIVAWSVPLSEAMVANLTHPR